jgi:hypothetical protein
MLPKVVRFERQKKNCFIRLDRPTWVAMAAPESVKMSVEQDSMVHLSNLILNAWIILSEDIYRVL